MDFNIAAAFRAVATALPDRVAVISGSRRLTYAELLKRSDQLAHVLASSGVQYEHGSQGATPECKQPRVAVYLRNRVEHVEVLLGCYSARAVPCNVNYRYRDDELRYLLTDMSPSCIVFESDFAEQLGRVIGHLPRVPLLIEVKDGHGPLLAASTEYEAALADASNQERCMSPVSPDDRYILYTGGTTGLPKGVVWRQVDIFAAILDGRAGGAEPEHDSVSSLVEQARKGAGRVLAAPPYMHGSGQWSVFETFMRGMTLVIQPVVERLDAADLLRTMSREAVTELVIVGDAYARPLLDELDRAAYDLPALQIVLTVGAFLNPDTKHRLWAHLPDVTIMDGAGASEMGGGLGIETHRGDPLERAIFHPDPGTCVLNEKRTEVLSPGHDAIGWLAKSGRLPLGYLNDPDRTASLFRVIDGVRYVVPGDRARLRTDHEIELLGRDSTTINSGGEKIYAEEVEAVLMTAPMVYDAIVVGRPSAQWGEEIVAIAQATDGGRIQSEEVRAHCRSLLASYKVPKEIIVVERIVRSPAGKADYAWARKIAKETS